MKKLILSFIISTTLLSAEITKENIGNYIYVNQHSTEFKIEKDHLNYYNIINLPNEKTVYYSRDIDAILSYIKKNNFKIIRKCGKLEVKEVKKEN